MITNPNTKINLGLNVLRKRPDGYHDIETVFVPYFGLRDTLEIVAGDDFSRTFARLAAEYGPTGENGLGGDSGPEERRRIRQGMTDDGKCMITLARNEGVDWDPVSDLCVRAYKALDSDYGLPPVKIFLEKTSPTGAGLGGGSADAAFTLRMLSEMFGLGLDEDALVRYAARLGSDCAFFVLNRTAFGQGRGEILSPVDIPALDALEIRVVVPKGIQVSTATAYRGIVPREAESPLLETLSRPVREWRDHVVNDFERPVFALFPELAEIRRELYDSGAVYAAMSGSGSALFGLFER